jgi:hypothetical protein
MLRGTTRLSVAFALSVLVVMPGAAQGQPTIKGFSPGAGKVGSTVVISGGGLLMNGVITSLTIGGAPASILDSRSTAFFLYATVPAEAGAGPIVVTTAAGTATSNSDFLVIPTITSFGGTSGPRGKIITLRGTGFKNTTDVLFVDSPVFGGDTRAIHPFIPPRKGFTVISGTEIQVAVPLELSGAASCPIRVVTPGGVASTGNFLITTDFFGEVAVVSNVTPAAW